MMQYLKRRESTMIPEPELVQVKVDIQITEDMKRRAEHARVGVGGTQMSMEYLFIAALGQYLNEKDNDARPRKALGMAITYMMIAGSLFIVAALFTSDGGHYGVTALLTFDWDRLAHDFHAVWYEPWTSRIGWLLAGMVFGWEVRPGHGL